MRISDTSLLYYTPDTAMDETELAPKIQKFDPVDYLAPADFFLLSHSEPS